MHHWQGSIAVEKCNNIKMERTSVPRLSYHGDVQCKISQTPKSFECFEVMLDSPRTKNILPKKYIGIIRSNSTDSRSNSKRFTNNMPLFSFQGHRSFIQSFPWDTKTAVRRCRSFTKNVVLMDGHKSKKRDFSETTVYHSSINRRFWTYGKSFDAAAELIRIDPCYSVYCCPDQYQAGTTLAPLKSQQIPSRHETKEAKEELLSIDSLNVSNAYSSPTANVESYLPATSLPTSTSTSNTTTSTASSVRIVSSNSLPPSLIRFKTTVPSTTSKSVSSHSAGNSTCSSRPGLVKSRELHKDSYSDPVIGANSMFQTRIHELITLENETIRFERQKRIPKPRRPKQD